MDTFKDRLLEALKRFFSSVKVITAIVGLIVALAAKRGIVLDPDDVKEVVWLFSVLIGAQGATDWGLRKAQVEAANPKPPETMVNQTNISGEAK